MSDNLYNDPDALYHLLVSRIATKEVGRQRIQALVEYCPFCGADNEKHLRASFGRIFDGLNWGYHCFACGQSCSLYSLAKATGVLDETLTYTRIERPIKDDKAPEYPSWYSGRQYLNDAYRRSPELYTEWAKYKGITSAMVDKYGLGYGVLPGDFGRMNKCPHYRLITPILDNSGGVVWFRGRAIACDCAKWLAAPLRDFSIAGLGVALPLSQYIVSSDIFITENYTDAALVNMSQKYGAVATLSTSYWFPHWTRQLYDLAPKTVYVAFDNDIAGNGGTIEDVKSRARKSVGKRYGVPESNIVITSVTPERNGYTIDYEIAGKSGVTHVPTPRGVVLANHLLSEGFSVILVKWPKNTSDMGQFLTS